MKEMIKMVLEILQNKIGMMKAQVISKLTECWIMFQHLDKMTINLKTKEEFNMTLKLMNITTSMMTFKI